MGRKLPIKTKRIELTGEYEGWWADVRTNPPVGPLLDAITAFESANKEKIGEIIPAIYDMLELIVHKWNFVDEKGKDLPFNRDSLRKLPLEVLVLLAQKSQEEILEVPLAPSTS
jgi:hypothetical protein